MNFKMCEPSHPSLWRDGIWPSLVFFFFEDCIVHSISDDAVQYLWWSLDQAVIWKSENDIDSQDQGQLGCGNELLQVPLLISASRPAQPAVYKVPACNYEALVSSHTPSFHERSILMSAPTCRFDPQQMGVWSSQTGLCFVSDPQDGYRLAQPFLREQMRKLLGQGWKQGDKASDIDVCHFTHSHIYIYIVFLRLLTSWSGLIPYL